MINTDKERFLRQEILAMTIGGAFGHGKVYRKTKPLPTAAETKRLRLAIGKELENLEKRYIKEVSEEQHVSNIKELANNLSRRFPDLLQKGRLRIGTAQKLLNLYLKYCWVLDCIAEPPHCPFDGTIIARLKSNLDHKINWTEMDSIDEYRELVRIARTAAETSGLSLAIWELKTFRRKTTY
jgi:hypothetical protein